MVNLVSRIYQGLFKRSSTFALTIVVGVFFFERAVDVGCDYVYDKYNEGKQWKDIKHRYVQE